MPLTFTEQERQALLNVLPIGRDNAICANRIAGLLGYPTTGNQVKLRGLIKECIEIDGDLIGASTGRPAGFYIIVTINELEHYLDSLENRTRSNNERRTALINNWNSIPDQVNTNRQILTIQ